MTKTAKNIIKGIGSAIEISPPSYRGSKIGKFTPASSVSKAIEGDWRRVGFTIKTSIGNFSKTHGQRKK